MILDNFKKSITDVINASGLTIDAVYFVMKDIMNEVVEIYNQQLQQERAEIAAQQMITPESSNEETNASASIEKKED